MLLRLNSYCYCFHKCYNSYRGSWSFIRCHVLIAAPLSVVIVMCANKFYVICVLCPCVMTENKLRNDRVEKCMQFMQ